MEEEGFSELTNMGLTIANLRATAMPHAFSADQRSTCVRRLPRPMRQRAPMPIPAARSTSLARSSTQTALRQQAERLGYRITTDADAHLIADEKRIDPIWPGPLPRIPRF